MLNMSEVTTSTAAGEVLKTPPRFVVTVAIVWSDENDEALMLTSILKAAPGARETFVSRAVSKPPFETEIVYVPLGSAVKAYFPVSSDRVLAVFPPLVTEIRAAATGLPSEVIVPLMLADPLVESANAGNARPHETKRAAIATNFLIASDY
jgi:hypothetical protein